VQVALLPGLGPVLVQAPLLLLVPRLLVLMVLLPVPGPPALQMGAAGRRPWQQRQR
jgi:hypothetical protein